MDGAADNISIWLELGPFELWQGLAADALLLALQMANRTMRVANRRNLLFGVFDFFLVVLVLGEQAAAGATGTSNKAFATPPVRSPSLKSD